MVAALERRGDGSPGRISTRNGGLATSYTPPALAGSTLDGSTGNVGVSGASAHPGSITGWPETDSTARVSVSSAVSPSLSNPEHRDRAPEVTSGSSRRGPVIGSASTSSSRSAVARDLLLLGQQAWERYPSQFPLDPDTPDNE